MDWYFCVLVFVQRFQEIEDTKADIISLLANYGDCMLESYDNVLEVSFDLQNFRVLHLDGSIIVLKLVELLVLVAVKTVVFSHPDNLEFSRQGDNFQFTSQEDLRSLDKLSDGVESLNDGVLSLRLDVPDDEFGGMKLGVLAILAVDGDPPVEQLLELKELGLVEVIGERVVFLDVFFEHEVELLGEGCSVEQVFEAEVFTDVFEHLPSVK